jgi:predicted alpha/beta-hydrolase family hydrolase
MLVRSNRKRQRRAGVDDERGARDSIAGDRSLGCERNQRERARMPERLQVPIGPDREVTAIAYSAAPRERAAITMILGHGAGAGQSSGFMVSFAEALAARGIDAVTFNFPYTQEGRRLPDPNDRLEACYRAVIDAVRRDRTLGRQPVAIGGKSMGGRIASQVAAAPGGDLAGVVLLGYPLHPPGKPAQLRIRHLPKITTPMLFVQGSRDTFGTPDELRPVLASLSTAAELHVVDSGDHSFRVLKRAGGTQEAVCSAIQDKIAHWLRQATAR